MSTQADADYEKVGLVIDGHEHRDWLHYEIDSDLLTPADAWRVGIGLPSGELPAYVRPWAAVTLTLGGQTVLRGRIDDVVSDVGPGRRTLELSGRDLAGVLVDCSAPIFTARRCSLSEVVAKIVRPLGITRVRVAAASSTRDKVGIEPGMTAWDALQQACEENGCWPYFDPSGTLVIGGPDYTDSGNPAVGQLALRFDGRGNNVLRLSLRRSIRGRYGKVTVLGQGHGGAANAGSHAIRAAVDDAAADFARPKVVVEGDCETTAEARRRARKILADGKLGALEIRATVAGHHVVGATSATGKTPLWTPGQRVRVLSEPHGLDGVYYLMHRTFLCSAGEGSVTELVLKPDGLWQPDVARHKRHRHKGKKAKGPGVIVDV